MAFVNLARRAAFGAVVATVAVGVPSRSDAVTPGEAHAWFSRLTVSDILPFVRTFPSWSATGATNATALSFGAAAPTLGFSGIPDYNLATGAVDGSTRIATALVPTGGYCARVVVDKRPVNVVVCGDPAADASGLAISSAADVAFLGEEPDLPAEGTTPPDHNFVGVVHGTVVALDQAAESWMGARELDGSVFVSLVAQQRAEWRAINKVNGAVVGGGIPLVGGNRADIEAFQAVVSRASGVPISRLTHLWSAPARGNAAPEPRHHAGWLLPAVSLAVLAGAFVALTILHARSP